MRNAILILLILFGSRGVSRAGEDYCPVRTIVTDSVRQTIQIKTKEDLENLLKMLGGENLKLAGISRTIDNPEVRECSQEELKVQSVLLTDSSTVVTLDIAACKKKLCGVDTSAYMMAGEHYFKIKELSGAKLPTSGKVALKVDDIRNTLDLIFPSLGMAVMGIREFDLVLSKEPGGIQIKGICLVKKQTAAVE